MTQITRLYGAFVGKSPMGGTDPEDLELTKTPIVIDNAAFDDAHDFVYDVRGVKQFSFSITNKDGANSLDWVLQQTEDPIPENGDLTGASWTDIDAAAALAFGVTAKKEFSRTTLLLSAVRLRVKETTPASDSSFNGRFVVGNYL